MPTPDPELARAEDLVAHVRALDAQMTESRRDMADLAAARTEAISELADLLGQAEAGRLLGVGRAAVHKVIHRPTKAKRPVSR